MTESGSEGPARDVRRAAIRAELEERAVAGDGLLVAQAFNPLDREDQRFRTWHEGNLLYVQSTFATESAGLYLQAYVPDANLFVRHGFDVRKHNERVSEFTRRLRSMAENIERLVLAGPVLGAPSAPKETTSKRVFIVHGRDEGWREAVARFLETKLKLQPVVLQEQASQGRTVIEKIEKYSDVHFAVVLMTPDDEGRLFGSEDPLTRRSRQNVVFELGFFMGLLGRGRVCVIGEPNMPELSDLKGLVTVLPSSDWQLPLAKEIRAAGVEVDFNNL